MGEVAPVTMAAAAAAADAAQVTAGNQVVMAKQILHHLVKSSAAVT